MKRTEKAGMLWCIFILAGILVTHSHAGGIPEPSLVLYGTIKDANTQARLTIGEIEWTFTSSNGDPPVVVSAQLQNINDQFSYVLLVPAESPIGMESSAPNTLQLAVVPTVYDLSDVQVNGEPAVITDQDLKVLELSHLDRGRIQRIDLQTQGITNDTDGNGIPDDWELAHFNQIGIDPEGDPDGDGLSNREEWKAGTDPNMFGSQFSIVTIEGDSQGGISIQWNSVEGRSYSVLRSTDLLGEFLPIASGLSATPPLNVYLDNSVDGDGPYFYLLRVEQ